MVKNVKNEIFEIVLLRLNNLPPLFILYEQKGKRSNGGMK